MAVGTYLVGVRALLFLLCFTFFERGCDKTLPSSQSLKPGRRPATKCNRLGSIALGALLVCGFGLAGTASAADVVVKGKQLEGSVLGVSSDGVEFKTIYGKGTLVVPWKDVEILRSDKEFEVLYGEAEIKKGRIWGLEKGALLVGESPDRATPIPVEKIYRSISREDYERSRLEALRIRYRYWNANFDFSLGYTDATTDTSSVATSFEVRRKKAPTEFFFGAYYLFGSTKEKEEDRKTNQNRLFGRTRLDYDLSDRIFAFGLVSAEYDEIQSLSIRTDPTIGIGYRFITREHLKLLGRIGPGYVYQRYFGGDTEDFFTILFGADLEADLPYGSKFRWTAEYLPSVEEWTDNYILRTNADWIMPITGWMDFKISVIDIYNNRPAPGTDRNSLATLTGLSLRF
jgi:putative salt-induced outer membrane protein YdiY